MSIILPPNPADFEKEQPTDVLFQVLQRVNDSVEAGKFKDALDAIKEMEQIILTKLFDKVKADAGDSGDIKKFRKRARKAMLHAIQRQQGGDSGDDCPDTQRSPDIGGKA